MVWSIGHQNFKPTNEKVHTTYPIGLRNVPFFVQAGFSLRSLSDNLVFFNPGTTLLGWLPEIRDTVDGRLETAVWRPEPQRHASRLPAAMHSLVESRRDSPETALVELLRNQKGLTSIAVHKLNGAYERVEIDSAFFRDKQREHALERRGSGHEENYDELVAAHPEYWELFETMLDMFREADVSLIVNEFEEAPYVYLTEARREAARMFMRERVAAAVRQRGYPYVRIDFDRLDDSDYFDYNHLNSAGVRKYSELLVEQLRPLVAIR